MSRDDLTNTDTELLVRAVYAVFRTVAEADLKVDAGEIESLRNMLRRGAESGDELFRGVLRQAVDECETRLAELGGAGEKAEVILSDAADLLESKLDQTDAQSFKVALIMMARRIAEASGGGFAGLGRKTSVEETVSLESIQVWLRAGDR